MYTGLLHAHSGLRWVVLILLIAAIFNAFGKKNGGVWTAKDKKITLFAMVFTHIQLVLGIILYFMSPKVQFVNSMINETTLRFYTVEHISLMLLAIVAITIGYRKSKRSLHDSEKFKIVALCYSIGLLLILFGIPCPFRGLGTTWI